MFSQLPVAVALVFIKLHYIVPWHHFYLIFQDAAQHNNNNKRWILENSFKLKSTLLLHRFDENWRVSSSESWFSSQNQVHREWFLLCRIKSTCAQAHKYTVCWQRLVFLSWCTTIYRPTYALPESVQLVKARCSCQKKLSAFCGFPRDSLCLSTAARAIEYTWIYETAPARCR